MLSRTRNRRTGSIFSKVDFDLTLLLLAHNLYQLLAKELSGFESSTAETLWRNFLMNGTKIEIKERQVTIQLKKKTHLPILLDTSWMRKATYLSGFDVTVNYVGWTVS